MLLSRRTSRADAAFDIQLVVSGAFCSLTRLDFVRGTNGEMNGCQAKLPDSIEFLPFRCPNATAKHPGLREHTRNEITERRESRSRPVTEYSLQASRTACCVPPKRILAQRLLRSVQARNSADQAPQYQLRHVEVRRVSASQFCVISQTTSRLPRSFAYRREGSRQRLAGVADTLKRAARVHLVTRMSERFAARTKGSGPSRVTAQVFISSLRSLRRPSRQSRPSRLQ